MGEGYQLLDTIVVTIVMRKKVVDGDDVQVVEVERFMRDLSLGWTLVDICSLHRSWEGTKKRATVHDTMLLALGLV